MVTLGLITTSIMVWGPAFHRALLKTRLGEESRPRQARPPPPADPGRDGDDPRHAAFLAVGGGCWSPHGLRRAGLVRAALGAQVRAALAPRFEFTVKAYIGAACLLPLGATLGAVMAFSPGEPWQGRLLLAHQVVNILGFRGDHGHRHPPDAVAHGCCAPGSRWSPHGARPVACWGCSCLVLGASAGALFGSRLLGCAFLLAYLGSFALGRDDAAAGQRPRIPSGAQGAAAAVPGAVDRRRRPAGSR